jgi:DNA-binding transcriptional regulator YdaS (Cro superfamily)
MSPKQALAEASRRVGSRAALGRALGVSKQAALVWRVAPARHVFAISRLSGLPRETLRPDLFFKARRKNSAGLARYQAALQALVEAVEAVEPAELGLTAASREIYLSQIALPVAVA